MENSELRDLIINNQNLIYSIIHKFRSKDYDDLFQAGCIGLINAYNNFNGNQGIKFTSYAYNYILGEVYKHIINNRNIHMSPVNVKLLSAIKRAEDYLSNHLERNPTDDDICSFLEISKNKLCEIRTMSLTDSLDYEYDNNNLYNFINCEDISKDELIDLKNALNSLTVEEKKLINARYFNNYTQQELARYYNTNQVKISREEKKILCKLKAKMY